MTIVKDVQYFKKNTGGKKLKYKKLCINHNATYMHTWIMFRNVFFSYKPGVFFCSAVPDKRGEMLLTRLAHVHLNAGRRLRGVEARELREDRAMGAHGDVGPLRGGVGADKNQQVTAFAAVKHLAKVVGQIGAVVQ